MEQYLSENKTVIYKVVAIKELTVLGVCKTVSNEGRNKREGTGCLFRRCVRVRGKLKVITFFRSSHRERKLSDLGTSERTDCDNCPCHDSSWQGEATTSTNTKLSVPEENKLTQHSLYLLEITEETFVTARVIIFLKNPLASRYAVNPHVFTSVNEKNSCGR